MSTVLLGSAKAAPGVTTAVLALASVWPPDRPLLVVEADPDGGVLAARCGLAAEPGLATLAVAGRRSLDPGGLTRHSQSLPGPDVAALVGPPAAEQTRRALDLCAQALAGVLGDLAGADVLIDAGRLGPSTAAWPLVHASDSVLLVARPQLEELQLLPARLRALRPVACRVGLLLVGERPYPPTEVAAALDVPVIGVLADDANAAAALGGERRGAGLARSALVRTARDTVTAVRAWLHSAGDRRPAAAGGVDHHGPGAAAHSQNVEVSR